MPEVPSPALPRICGGFRLVRELGRGGMGVVYEAEELDSGRAVALKVLAADLSVSGEAFERFRREARLAAAISDAHCVFVYGAHQVEGAPAIAMELVGGETLQEKVARGDTIPIETAVRWIIDVVDGLEAAHRAGVLHRDVKPSNCFVTLDGRVKIGDFGLSRALERDVELTQSGQFLGSPLYASPEQIRGRSVDARSDQYSCAATLYALLTGRAPFGGSNIGEVLARILSEPAPRPRSIRPEIPRELEKVVLRAMEREPERRFRDLEAFREALLPFSSSEAGVGPPWRRIGAWAVDTGLLGFVSSASMSLAQGLRGEAMVDPQKPWVAVPLWIQLAVGVVPILYFGLLEGWRGGGLGKWLFGLRVAAAGQGPGLVPRALLRATVFEGPLILLAVLVGLLATNANVYALGSLAGMVLSMAFRVSTMRRANGWRGPHELWSGTRVVQARLPFRRVRRAAPPPQVQERAAAGLPERVGEYRVLGVLGATRSGALLHARDERLERSVWIQLRESAPPAGERRRALARPARLRWLEALRVGGVPGDVFESPGGCGLPDLAQHGARVEWPLVERLLAALADELARCEEEAGGPPRWSPGQIWFDRHWNVRVLDEPLPADAGAALSSVEALGAAARALIAAGGGERELPRDLPLHAEPLLRALLGQAEPFRDLAAVRAALAASQAAHATVERRTRSAQMAVGSLLWTLLLSFGVVVYLIIAQMIPHLREMHRLLRELETGQVTAVVAGRSAAPLDEDGRRARQLVLSYELTHGYGPAVTSSFDGEDMARCTEARRAFPSPAEGEMAAALQRIRAERARAGAPEEPEDELRASIPYALLLACTAGTALWALVALAGSLLWPGGLSFRLFSLSLRDRRGRRATRWLGLVRWALIALPLPLGYGAGLVLLTSGAVVAAWIVFALVALLQLAGVGLSLWEPSRGPADRALGTTIVPR